jgi:hypothetical protein
VLAHAKPYFMPGERAMSRDERGRYTSRDAPTNWSPRGPNGGLWILAVLLVALAILAYFGSPGDIGSP